MKTMGWMIILILCAGLAGGIGFAVGRYHPVEAKDAGSSESTAAPDEEDKPVVQVTTAPAEVRTISQIITAYGTVIAQPAEVQVVSAGFECRVLKLLVSPGQQLIAGADTIQVEASPDSLISLQEAKNAAAGADRDLAQVQQRFKQHLATNTELAQSELAAQSARLKLDNLIQRGVGSTQTYKARTAGIVSKIDVQEGQIAAAGAPLIELVPANRIEVQLSLEPADAQALRPGIKVELQPAGGSPAEPAIAGEIRMIAQRVDPLTRMVDARVSLPQDAHLMLDSFVIGRLTGATAEGFIIPRDAALPNEDGSYSIYTVKESRAVLHSIQVGLQQDQVVQVIAADLKAGDPVVVSGNYMLKNGMQVEVRSPSSQPDVKTEAK
jgi:RND family efflux transporter MFP subunit